MHRNKYGKLFNAFYSNLLTRKKCISEEDKDVSMKDEHKDEPKQRRRGYNKNKFSTSPQIITQKQELDTITFEMNSNGCFVNGKPFDAQNPPSGIALSVDQKSVKS